MNHVNAFFMMPAEPVLAPPSRLYRWGVASLLFFHYIAHLRIIEPSNKKLLLTELKRERTPSMLAISLLLFIPGLILGIILKALSYMNSEVRKFHRQVVAVLQKEDFQEMIPCRKIH